MTTVLIAGAGLAGARTAETLRSLGFDGRIVLAGDEPHPPYERPALSKELLGGKRDDIELRPRTHWRDLDIQLELGSPVRSIRPGEAIVGGELFPWDEFVLATGARLRRPGGLRTLVDARRLRARLTPGARLVVVGAGFVGCEVASTALDLGADVTVVEAAKVPLERILGVDVGQLLAQRMRAHGVDLRLGTSEIPDHDVLLWAIGVEPDTRLLPELEVDACGRTQYPNIYAAGDVTGTGHWTAAAGQAVSVAHAILGEDRPHDEAAYFWSDQFGLRLQLVGDSVGATTVELDGPPDGFRAIYRAGDGRVIGTLLVNRPAEVAAVRAELAA